MLGETFTRDLTIRDYRSSVTQTAAPSVEPVTTADQKTFMRVDHSAEDSLIGALITAARLEVENYTGLQLITATYVMRMDRFPVQIIVPKPPLQSVTSLAYNDTDGAAQTLTENTDFKADIYRLPGRIVPAVNAVWPTTYGDLNDVTLTYKAGYGDASTDVPDPLIQAVKMITAHLYEHREQFLDDAKIEKCETAERLMNHYRIRGEVR